MREAAGQSQSGMQSEEKKTQIRYKRRSGESSLEEAHKRRYSV